MIVFYFSIKYKTKASHVSAEDQLSLEAQQRTTKHTDNVTVP